MESAYAGVLEANATFVDQAIFGPSVDGKSWNGKWSVASLYSSLMLVTIEDAGADTQVNIWDLTEVSSSAPSTTPLGTVTLSGDATPTSVAVYMAMFKMSFKQDFTCSVKFRYQWNVVNCQLVNATGSTSTLTLYPSSTWLPTWQRSRFNGNSIGINIKI